MAKQKKQASVRPRRRQGPAKLMAPPAVLMVDPQAEREAMRYADPIPSRTYILSLFTEETSLSRAEIEVLLSLDTEQAREALRRRLIAMTRDSQLTERGGFYRRLKGALGPCVEGPLKIDRDGSGYISIQSAVEESAVAKKTALRDKPRKETPAQARLSARAKRMEGRVYLSAAVIRDLAEGDHLVVRTLRVGAPGLLEEVKKPVSLRIVGQYRRLETGQAFIEPRYTRRSDPIALLPSAAALSIPQEAWVLVEVARCPRTHFLRWEAEVVHVFGELFPLALESHTAIERHHLPHVFSPEVQAAAEHLPDFQRALSDPKRVDLRHCPFVTIDGEDARDFDDAVYGEAVQGGFRLRVAIADVSYYVETEGVIDSQARQRGTSVYFPQRVIPMLPPILADELCSLMPGEDRLAVVCDSFINAQGVVERYDFYRATICSQKRYTYTEVAALLEDEEQRSQHSMLCTLEAIFDALYQQRLQRGAIDFETHETRICFNEQGSIEKILPVRRNKAHRIIEECMLQANVAAAAFLAGHQEPTLYRVHAGPTAEKLMELRDYLKILGLSLGKKAQVSSKDYALLLRAIQERPDKNSIQMTLLRSLSQAIYTPHMAPHFGLCYDSYVHFTSPIRRYPDLMVHRGIVSILNHRSDKAYERLKDHLPALGEHCSMTERRADESAREVVMAMKCHYMHSRLGEEFQASISGLTHFGIFAEIQDLYVEGLIHISSLKDDYYQYDPLRGVLQGERTRRCFRLGDTLRVRVARVDILERRLDFQWIAAESEPDEEN